MSHLRLMISMDSGNMHLASLVNTPVVSIWGATHPYAGFMGWHQSPDNAVQLDMPCRPCSIYGNKPCMRGDLLHEEYLAGTDCGKGRERSEQKIKRIFSFIKEEEMDKEIEEADFPMTQKSGENLLFSLSTNPWKSIRKTTGITI